MDSWPYDPLELGLLDAIAIAAAVAAALLFNSVNEADGE